MNQRRKVVTAHVTGRVQGVSYRVWARNEAEALGLTGWVRNEIDGSVRGLLIGSEDAVAAMISRLRVGPPAAAVANVEVEDAEVEAGDMPDRFLITR